VQTVVRALAYADLSKVDGETVLAPGEEKTYGFDLRASLRTYNQKKTFERLVGSRAIEIQLVEPAEPDEQFVLDDQPESPEAEPGAGEPPAESAPVQPPVLPEVAAAPAVEPPAVEPAEKLEAPPAVEAAPAVEVPAGDERLSAEDKLVLLADLGLKKKMCRDLLKCGTKEEARQHIPMDDQLVDKVLEILSL
jgi:hypothetical protein